MYERFFNLRERPFALSPDPDYLYLSRVHREAMDSIRYGIESHAGFIVVTGEIGAGKTTLLQSLLGRLDERTVVARIVHTMLDPRELLEAIALEFGIDGTAQSKPMLLRELGAFLVQQRSQGRRPLLVIDEAQNLSPQALEEVRLLSNLETEKSKLLQILLVGQPNLRDAIASPELEQFRQRVAVSYHLLPLDAADTAAYINFRLEHAAVASPPRFSPDACAIVHEVSGGVPRVINVVCEATLVFGYAEGRRDIDGALLEEVVKELETTHVLTRKPAGERAAIPDVKLPAAPVGTLVQHRAWAPEPVRSEPAAVASFGATRDRVAAPNSGAQSAQLLAAREAELAEQLALIRRRGAELASQERALLQRERQIAEQRRIMSEEYRLLRQGQASRSAAPGSGPGTTRLSHSSTSPSSATSHLSSSVALWQRIVRIITGGHPVRS
jgi:putative secretion ATPase (PEP-CTERM system associated)